jgi:penicillin-binding protein 2
MFDFSEKKRIYFQTRRVPDIEPHEVLLDKLAKKKEEELGISGKKLEVPLFKRVFQGFFYFSILLIFLLFLRTFQFQVIEGKEYLGQSFENRYIFHKIQAQRGVIYDRNLKQLSFNRPGFDLVCQKNNLPQLDFERKKVLNEVSQILKINSKELEKIISESEDFTFPVFRNLDHQTLLILETKIGELPGFEIFENSIREYRDGEDFAHLIGYTGKIKSEEFKEEPEFYSIFDDVGREGIESSYEKVLRKNPGKIRIERDALGNIISKEIISLPESGKSLVLYLDSDLQRKIKETLEKKVKEVGAKGAAAVALDPKTGGVLALVSLPTFDNNIFSKGDQKAIQELLDPKNDRLFNRVIKGKYLTGSTLKPLIASAALEEKIISPDKKINDSEGKIVVRDFWNPEKVWEYKDWKIHGWTDMRKAIAESCNVYFYTIGGGYGDQKGLGPTKIKEYLEKFGWNQKTGIDLPGEVEGFIPDKDWKKRTLGQGWWDGDTYNLSIGQGYLKITPLEVATAFLSIANGGKLLKPQIVQKIVDKEKNLVEEIQPQILNANFIDSKNLRVVREGMRQTVTAGSATGFLDTLSVSAAAKTGTAELGGDYYHNWITVFAPYDDPKIVLTIVIEKVKDVRVAALPVAQEILNWYFTK